MIRRLFFFFVFSVVGPRADAQAGGWQNLVPPGFTILDSASGDINRDGLRDYVVILKNDDEEEIGDTTRPLLLITGRAGGSFQLAERNDNVVMCKNCGGAFGDPYAAIVIKNNYFSIEHYGGSNWRWTRVITFRYDAKTKNFLLHRDAGTSWHNSNIEKTEEHVYRKQDFGKKVFSRYNNEAGW